MSDALVAQENDVRPRYALQRVLLIDSYTAGRITELPVEGGTAIVSPNGRGKTSLLQLIPAFYGERPDRIVKPVSNQGNFARYYLPRSTSYIIFEYRRDGVACCSVLCADASGEGVEYRFVRGAFRREWFVHDDETTLVASANLFERLKLLGATCTRKMPLDQYRAIIQAKRAHGSDLKQHRRDILEYAYGPGTHPLLHIERIVFGMFMRKSNFVDLQRMIVATVTDATGKIALGAERKKIEAWPDAFDSYAAVMAEAPRMDPVQHSYDAVLAAEQELRNIHGRFLSIDRQLDQEQRESQREQDLVKTGLAEAEQNYLDHRRGIVEQIEKAERAIKDTTATLAFLETQRESYHAQDVQAKAALLDRETEIEQTKTQLVSRKAVLLSELSNIEDAYRKMIDDLTLQHKDRQFAFERQRSAARAANQSRFEALHGESKEQEDGVRQNSLEGEMEIQAAIGLASKLVGEATVRVSNPQPAPELVEIAEQQQAKVDEAHARLLDAMERETDAKKVCESKRAAFSQTESSLRQLHAQTASENEALDDLLTQASPDENSVLYMLRDKRPDWTQDIARVLREDILTRTDLSPVIGALQDSVYGLQIDLDLLDTPLIADELAIQREIEATREELKRLALRVEEQDALLAQTGAERKSAEDAVARKSADTAMANTAKSSAEQQLRGARLEVQRSRDSERNLAQQALVDAQANLKAAEQRLVAHRERLVRDIAALVMQHQQRTNELRQELNDRLKEIDSAESDEKKRYETATSQIDEERKAKLKASGVDTVALTSLEQQIAEVTAQLKTIADSRNLVVDWRRWLGADWSRKPVHEGDLIRAQREKSFHGGELQACEKAWQEDANKRKGLIHELGKQLSGLAEKRAQVGRQRASLSQYTVETSAIPPYDPAWRVITLVGQASMQERARKSEENRLQQEIGAIKRMFTASRHSPADQYYETQRQIIGPDRADKAREWVPAFKAWYSSEHEHYRNLLRVDARTIAEAVGDFRDRMDTFHRKVQQFNRELQENLNANQGFRAIGGLTVEIVSSIRELEYWGTIERVAESRREWMEGDLTDLPPPEFGFALRELLNHWQIREGIQAELTNLVRIQGEVIENGNRRPFKKAEDLERISSNGLSYIAMVLIFVAFINRVRGNTPVNVVWALDEIGALDTGNVILLVEILTKNNITLVTACPDPKPDVLALFRNRRSINSDRRIYDPSTIMPVAPRVVADENERVSNV
nr:hypothetical protein HUO10_005414 [Paraburkholderia busanensis]